MKSNCFSPIPSSASTPRVNAILAATAALATMGPASAAVLVEERFNYDTQAELEANWTLGTAPLALDTTTGNPAPHVSHPGNSTSPNVWKGSTFSLTPTNSAPIRLTADLLSTGAADQSNTVGLRTGANPLFEMGMHRFFDNIQTGPNSSEALSPSQDGFGTRTINLGEDLPGQDWVKFGDNFTGWARFEAVFTENSITTRVDLGINGVWDHTFTETGTGSTGAFSELRIHSPSVGTGGGFGVDNVVLEVIPEPSSALLIALGGLFAILPRRRR